MSEERFDRLEHKIDAVTAELRQDMATQAAELGAVVEQKAEELRRHMGVLHEDTIERLAALAPDFRPVRRDFAAADAELREEFDRRVTPLEADARRRR